MDLLMLQNVKVYATDGDDTLGGSDLDLCIAKSLKTKIEEKAGKNYESMEKEISKNGGIKSKIFDELCINPSIHSKAEQIKKNLSSAASSIFSCIGPNNVKIEFPFTRSEFHVGCKSIFDRALLPVSRLLGDLEMTGNDIDEIVLVGGSTRIPYVKEMLKEFFGKDLNDHIDPDITVAYGAASILD